MNGHRNVWIVVQSYGCIQIRRILQKMQKNFKEYSRNFLLEAAFYYAENFPAVKAFVLGMDNDSQAMIQAKCVLEDPQLPTELAVIKGTFLVIAWSIKALEERQSLVKAMEVAEKVQENLTLEPFARKLNELLKKNPGFETLQKVSRVLRGECSSFESHCYDPNLPSVLRNVPLVTVDCERCFSALKGINSPKRLSLSEAHVGDAMII